MLSESQWETYMQIAKKIETGELFQPIEKNDQHVPLNHESTIPIA